jgi:DNA modification methylase
MHRTFNEDARKHYWPDFFDHLLAFHPTAIRRDCALVILNVTAECSSSAPYEHVRDSVLAFVERTYERLSNHCYLAILIEPISSAHENAQWRFFSDLVLFAEKHREVRLATGYFAPNRIQADTVAHVPILDVSAAHFEVANEGFFFKDCFVLLPNKEGRVETTDAPVNLLVLFEKNERDETLVPCPGCRSKEVAGNSYPVLGVRSWECQNPICPERSAFDRGNRYSVSALIKQRAINSQADQIPESSLRKWKLDVVSDGDARSVGRMLTMHFSLHGDTIVFVNMPHHSERTLLGREVVHEKFTVDMPAMQTGEHFQRSVFFKRFVVERRAPDQVQLKRVNAGLADVDIYEGDCFDTLEGIPDDSVDGAVTSPPYYNARSYATWPNIYSYLYDMYNDARQVIRVLRPGAFYLFNVFDYFDNENIIVMSSMGKKRMILGAYIINIFRRAGFELHGNVVWYKGEIEGKRNFNQGNRSPYYQFPFNCWEHVLVFRKPGSNERQTAFTFPTVLHAKPVIKMVRGQNVHGHSAPFPEEIPSLLVDQMRPGDTVLDPFAGSLTTARVARKHGVRSISVELHRDYCDLGVRLLKRDEEQPSMFEDFLGSEV